jgi:hypothetical protein
MADIAAKLDDIGKPAWIGVMVAGFIIFWPAGLAILGYLIWSGRMGNWKRFGMSDMGRARGRWYGACGAHRTESSGNAAFDEYREETLRRLEEEQKEFGDYLERLRQAKDKAEFDAFMAEQKRRPHRPDDAQPQA